MIDELGACQNLTTNAENLSTDALHRTPSSSASPVPDKETRKETDVVRSDLVTDKPSQHHVVSVHVPYHKYFFGTSVSGLA